MGLQIINSGETSGGYANGVSSGKLNNWTNVGMSGSHSSTFYWYDRGVVSADGESRVDMTIKNEWTATHNPTDNSITVKVKGTIVSMTRTVTIPFRSCSAAYYNRRLRYWWNGAWRADLYNDCREGICYTHNIWNNKVLGETTVVVPAGQETTAKQGFFIRNDSCGWSQSYNVTDINYDVEDHGWFSDAISGSIRFRNTYPVIPPKPTITLNCSSVPDTTDGKVTASYVGEQVSNFEVVLADNSSYSPVLKYGTGQWTLAPNTTYYAKATATNPGGTSTKTCQFTTLASSAILGYKNYDYQASALTVTIDNGGDACDVSSVVYLRDKGADDWKQIYTTSETGTLLVPIGDYTEYGNEYEAKIESTNCAGTYHSTIFEFATPEFSMVRSEITTTDSKLDESGQSVDLSYCYRLYDVRGGDPETVIRHRLEYRLKGEEEWQLTDTKEVQGVDIDPSSIQYDYCSEEPGLICDSVYELRVWAEMDMFGGMMVESGYSPIVEYRTPLCGNTYNCMCDNLFYMVELICQELNMVKNGEKTIYANCQTKKLCDPYSMNPTWESILSRILRYSQAVVCLLCSMDNMDISSGEDGEVYRASEPGQYGYWEKLDTKTTEDSPTLISSGAVKTAINTYVKSVWHPIGVFNYFSDSLEDLSTEAPSPEEGQTAVVGTNAYKYTNGEWVIDEALTKNIADNDPFGVISITDGTTNANKEYYIIDGEWSQMDFNQQEVNERLNAAEDILNKAVLNEYADEDFTSPNPAKSYNMLTAYVNDTDEDIWGMVDDRSDNTVILLVDGKFTENPFVLDVDKLDSGKELI